MREDMTLGELKAHCEDMEYCADCEFEEIGCQSAPTFWKLESVDSEKVCEGQPDWAEMYQLAYEEREECRNRANYLEADNKRLCTILKAIEFVLGRKIDL